MGKGEVTMNVFVNQVQAELLAFQIYLSSLHSREQIVFLSLFFLKLSELYNSDYTIHPFKMYKWMAFHFSGAFPMMFILTLKREVISSCAFVS